GAPPARTPRAFRHRLLATAFRHGLPMSAAVGMWAGRERVSAEGGCPLALRESQVIATRSSRPLALRESQVIATRSSRPRPLYSRQVRVRRFAEPDPAPAHVGRTLAALLDSHAAPAATLERHAPGSLDARLPAVRPP